MMESSLTQIETFQKSRPKEAISLVACGSTGQSLVGVLVSIAIAGILMAVTTSIIETQGRESRAISEKLASNDLEKLLIPSLADGLVCQYVLNKPTSLTFDPNAISAGHPQVISLPSNRPLYASINPGPPETPGAVVAEVGKSPSAYSNTLTVGAINLSITECSGVTGTITCKADWIVQFDNTKIVRALVPNSVSTRLTATVSGTTATVTACQGGGDQCWKRNDDGSVTDTCGNVGIGTPTPITKLDVAGSLTVGTSTPGVGSRASFRRGTDGQPSGYVGFDAGAILQLVNASGNESAIDLSNLGFITFSTNTRTTERMRIDSAGHVGIGTTSPGEKLEIAGNVKATAFLYSSDRRLKENIEPLDGYDKTLQLQGVSFNWKSNGRPEIGFIAQDVEKIVPELVVTDRNGMKSVKYGNVTALLVEAFKTQAQEIAELKSKVEQLSRELACQKGAAKCASSSR